LSVSVIIPYNNAALYLELCLSSLLKERESIDEVIVVSNGNAIQPSKPAGCDGLVRIIRHDEALGYAGAINRGVEESGGSCLIFCDADTFFPHTGWIAKHLELRKARPEIGITSSKLLNYRTDRILDFGIGRTRFNNFHPCRDAPRTDPRVQRSRRVQMACSAVMMIDKTLFQQVGGFDRSLRYHYQDIDLSLRLKQANREVWIVADAIAYHRGHSSNIVRAPFQTDERAHFTLKNAELFEVDYPDYLDEALGPYREHLSSAGPFGMVNLSTLVNLDEILELVAPITKLENLSHWTPMQRDLEFIAIPDVVDAKVMRYPGPLVIIVDRFSSLRLNSLWSAARDTSADMVIDRHANVYRFDEITEIS
jgi:GT2 family glycosyltransferase